MEKKAECEKAIRSLCHVWAKDNPPGDHPSFSAFKRWLHAKGYGHYLNFRAVGGAEFIAEMWFDQEFKQTWRR
jgi:hypothetical protein